MKKLLSDFLNLFTPYNKIEVHFWWIIILIILLLTLVIAYSIYFALKERNKELSKKDLARKKLISEIRNFKLFWLTPSLSLATTVVVAIVGWRSGFFETNLKLIEIKTIKLQMEEDSLKSRKLKLNKDLIKLSYKYDSIRGKLDSIAELNLSLKEKAAIDLNTIEMQASIIENKDTINARLSRDLKKWTQSEQSPLELKSEVLMFVKELENLLSLIAAYPDANFTGKIDGSGFSVFNNPINYIYMRNYQEKALFYRNKIDYVLGKDQNNSEVTRWHTIYMESPATYVEISYVADDLEAMANKITK